MPVPQGQAAAHRKVGAKFLSEALAENARQLRSLRDLSQDDVAERMRALGHQWSRQTTSDVERAKRNVTIDELLGLAIVLAASISDLLDPRGVLRDFTAAVDPGDRDLPYTESHRVDDPTPIEIPGSAGIGLPPAVVRAIVEGRIKLSLTWDGWGNSPAAIGLEPVEGYAEDFTAAVEEIRRRATREES
jgi:transcriptional regulator with XRE-family HTH domain